jgi:TPR repeat protein
MRRTYPGAFKVLALAIALMAALTVPSWAGFEDGLAAHERGDYALALEQWKPLAEQGDARAQYRLGAMYARGEGVPRDDGAAAQWFLRAAGQGHTEANYVLSFAYAKGLGVPRDDARAAYSLRRAAELGHAEAQYRLGVMYANGKGVPRDYVLAHVWFDLAAAQGVETAARKRRFAAERMMPSEIAKARRLARELRLKQEAAGGF